MKLISVSVHFQKDVLYSLIWLTRLSLRDLRCSLVFHLRRGLCMFDALLAYLLFCELLQLDGLQLLERRI